MCLYIYIDRKKYIYIYICVYIYIYIEREGYLWFCKSKLNTGQDACRCGRASRGAAEM